MELFLDVLGESLVDTAKMLPFLFLAYLFIEYVENRHGERIEAILAGGGRWGSVPAALLGCVPQCGFSAIASNFYASRVISLGTLMAVFLATSDEAVPLLVSMPAYWDKLVLLMVIKVLYAIAVGLVLDFVLRGVLPRSLRGGYTGSADDALWLAEQGLYIGFGGACTFQGAKRAAKAIAALPLERIVLETDCPYMAPEPVRGTRCDSSLIRYVGEYIAQIKGVSEEAVFRQTAENAKQIYQL